MKRFFALALFSCMTSLCFAAAAQVPSSLIEAENFNLKAYQQYDRGQYESAIALWENALILYRKNKVDEKAGEVLIEIAQAKLSMGEGVLACITLQQYLKAETGLCTPANEKKDIGYPAIGNSENHVIAAMDFARILRDFGSFEQALLYAQASLQAARENNFETLIPDLSIGKANLDLVKLMFDRDQWRYQEKTHLTDVEAKQLINRFELIFEEYEQQFVTPIELEAKLKWLTTNQELFIQSQYFRNDEFQAFPDTLTARYISLLQEIAGYSDFNEFVPSEQLRVRFEIARILNEANQRTSNESLKESSYVWIKNLITSAERFNHQNYLASGYGLLGQHYQSMAQPEQAIKAYQLAVHYSQVTHPRHRWHHNIAKLYESIGNDSKAEQFYSSAITLVDEARWNISPVDQSIKTHFQESVRPIFNDFIEFQLNQSSPNFLRILKLRNQYTEKVLENYLGCTLPEPIEIGAIKESDPNVAIISIFKINDQYITVLENSDQFDVSKTDAQQIDSITQQLAFNFAGENQKYPIQTLNHLYQQLYELLIQPINGKIKPTQTILFTDMQPELQRIPMALMFDGSQYLIERNPIALAGNTLYRPKKMASSMKNILFAGITHSPDKSNNFADIPFVEAESKQIDPQKILLNKDFTTSNLASFIKRDFTIVHLATHGQFSSNPAQTFLTAWNDKIGLPELTDLLESRKNAGSPIELLILSACETAKGDRLAALGMAGFSIQSGARSTLASLWKAIDESSPFFMGRFYAHLDAGESKAKALQLAQIDMIELQYPPYSWGMYILTGSWL